MKNLLKILLIFFFSTNISFAFFEVVEITPTSYKVTVEKVELCESGSTLALCLNPIVLGEGSQEMDIAAVDVGATAGSYGNPAKMVPGTTYTFIQTTLNREMKMIADSIMGGGGRYCATGGGSSSAGSKSAFANGQGSNQDNLTPTEQVIYISDVSSTHAVAGITTAGSGNLVVDVSMGSGITGIDTVDGTGTATSITTSHQYVQHRVALTTPFTVGLLTPNVDIAFGVENSLFAYFTNDKNNNGGVSFDCAFWAGEPSVSVTFK